MTSRNQAVAPIEGSEALHAALDMVGAMSDAGLTVVPVNPSKQMLAKGAQAGQVSRETAYRIFRAMIQVDD